MIIAFDILFDYLKESATLNASVAKLRKKKPQAIVLYLYQVAHLEDRQLLSVQNAAELLVY